MSTRRMLIAVMLVGSTFLIAHTINAVVAEALLAPARLPIPPATVGSEASTARSASALAEQVRTSGLFPIPPDPLGIGGAASALLPRQPLNLASKMKLLGVVIGDKGGVSAIVEMLASKQQMFFRLHDQIPEVGELSEIRKDGVVVRQGDQQELLELNSGLGDVVPKAAAAPIQAVEPGGPIRKTIDRREVDQAMNDLPKLLSQARAVPVLVNGAMNGFRLDYIAPSSFYEKIGLQYGDVLKQVNGVEIKDPGTMLNLFQQLRNERTVKLDVVRNNQRTTLTYDIR
jgi:general secretion pathway protein C